MFSHKHWRFTFLIVSGLFIFTAFNGARGASNLTQLCLSGDCISAWSEVVTMGAWATATNGIYYNSGNVGIGTTDPGDKLTVSGGNVNLTGNKLLNTYIPIQSYDLGEQTIGYFYDNLFGSDKKFTVTSGTGESTDGLFDARPETQGISFSPAQVTANQAWVNVNMGLRHYWRRISISFPWGTGYAGSSSFLIQKYEDVNQDSACETWTTVADQTNFSGYEYSTTANLGNYICQFKVTFRNTTGSQNVVSFGEFAAYQFYNGDDGPYVKRNGDRIFGGLNIDGKVGIGTTAPDKKLEVYNGDIMIHGGTGGTSNKLIFKTTDDADLSKSIGMESYWTVIGAHGNEGWKFKDNTGDIVMQINGIGGNNGYVGIGTTNPLSTLDIPSSSSSFYVQSATINSLGITGQNSMVMSDAEGNLSATSSASLLGLWGGTKNGNIWNGDAGLGNVGIGTTNPGAKLAVLGGIKAGNSFVGPNANSIDVLWITFPSNNTDLSSIISTYGGGRFVLTSRTMTAVNAGSNTDFDNFDVIIMGFQDGGFSSGVSPNSTTQSYLLSHARKGKGLIFTHDTIGYMLPAITEYFREVTGIYYDDTITMNYPSYSYATGNTGLITTYPYTLSGNLTTSNSHNTFEHAEKGTVYYRTTSGGDTNVNIRLHAYRSVVTLTLGHVAASPVDDQKMIINALYYAGTADGNGEFFGALAVGADVITGGALVSYGTGKSYFMGNVGIGTTAPLSKLDISGGTGDGDTYNSVLSLSRMSSTGNRLVGKIVLDDSNTNNGDIRFKVKTTASAAESDAYYTDAMIIKGVDGKVGIGTTAPNATLDVAGSIKASGFYTIGSGKSFQTGVVGSSVYFDVGNLYVRNGNASSNGKIGIAGSMSIGNTYWNVAAPSDGLAVEGIVGIGTTNPLYTLDIPNMDSSLFVQNAIIGSLGIASQNSIVMADSDGYLSAASPDSLSLGLWGGTKNNNIWNGDAGAGNVGIGTTNPTDKLHIIGNTTISGVAGCTGTGSVIKTDASGRLVCGTITGGITGSGTGNYTARWTGSGTLGTGALFDNGSRVSVGGAAPNFQFQVGNNSADFNSIGLDTTDPTGEKPTLYFGTGNSYIMFDFDSSPHGMVFNAKDKSCMGCEASDFKFLTNGVQMFTIKGAGNVGIGTTAPDAKLDVAGTFRLQDSNLIYPNQTSQGSTFEYPYVYTITVDGDPNKYYPVSMMAAGNGTVAGKFVIARSYGEAGPIVAGGDSGHIGGLQAVFTTMNAAWSDYTYLTLQSLRQIYVRTIADCTMLPTESTGRPLICRLRGGGFVYRIYSNYPINPAKPTPGGVAYSSDPYTFYYPAALPLASLPNNVFQADTDVPVDVITPRLIIQRSTGRVGIGTADPLATLDIPDGASSFYVQSATINSLGIASQNSIVMSDAEGNLSAASAASLSLGLWGGSSGGNIWNANSSNVGIGTIAPNASLSLGAANGKRFLVYDGGVTSVQAGLGVDMSGTGRELSIFHSTSNNSDGNISFGRRLESSGAYAELMRIQGNGKVGIGTTNPFTNLDVKGAGAAITVGNIGLSEGALYLGNPSHGIKRNYSAVNDVGVYTTSGDLYLSGAGAVTTQFVLKNSGNVGIGTASPGARLDIAGAQGQIPSLQVTSPQGDGTVFQIWGRGKARFDNYSNCSDGSCTAGVTIVEHAGLNALVVTGGNVGIGTTAPGATLEIKGVVASAGTALKVTSDGNADDKVFHFTGNDAAGYNMVMLQTGNVGIGTTSPWNKLTVAGNIGLRSGDLIKVSEDSGVHDRTIFGTSVVTAPAGQYFSFIQSPDSDVNDGVQIRPYNGTQANALVTILNGGNVGIGTTNPTVKLDVTGAVKASGGFVLPPACPVLGGLPTLAHGNVTRPNESYAFAGILDYRGVYINDSTDGSDEMLYWASCLEMPNSTSHGGYIRFNTPGLADGGADPHMTVGDRSIIMTGFRKAAPSSNWSAPSRPIGIWDVYQNTPMWYCWPHQMSAGQCRYDSTFWNNNGGPNEYCGEIGLRSCGYTETYHSPAVACDDFNVASNQWRYTTCNWTFDTIDCCI